MTLQKTVFTKKDCIFCKGEGFFNLKSPDYSIPENYREIPIKSICKCRMRLKKDV